MIQTVKYRCLFILVLFLPTLASWSVEDAIVNEFKADIQPILENSCFVCHSEGEKLGNISFFDYKSDADLLSDHVLWDKVVHNMRSGIMPPNPIFRPTSEEYETLYEFVKYNIFEIDPDNIDPGHVTLRRLNRQEYRNTINDLMGVDYNATAEFPPDDTGYGFDTIGDVLSISPMLLEKYVQAAEDIVDRAVPKIAKILPESRYAGTQFKSEDDKKSGDRMNFYDEIQVARKYYAKHDGDYKVIVDVEVDGAFDFDPGECRVVFTINGEERFNETYQWHDNKELRFAFDEAFEEGRQTLAFHLVPLVTKSKQKNKLDFEINRVTIQGPMDRAHWEHPKNYTRFFHLDEAPEDKGARLEYAQDVLSNFAAKAFRRPANETLIEKLALFAEQQYNLPGRNFEEGVAQAMVTVLASPRFLFRFEGATPETVDDPIQVIDEYALASRLSYFLWSTMPDRELFELAEKGELRSQLRKQIERMASQERAEEFIQNFVGQWLQTRDIEVVPIDVHKALGLPKRKRGEKRLEFEKSLRIAMRQETEMMFAHIMREDRSLIDMIDSDYTFLNEELAKHYGIDGVKGKHMRKVKLGQDSPRGGVLTHGAFLTVTSNPTRTSPVKRGLYIIENILGAPAPGAPPEAPELEEAEKKIKESVKNPTMRQLMELHRSDPMCASCHTRFDPLGLALENFNALGVWRDNEHGSPIDASGELITGESFDNIVDVKQIIKDNHREEFYRCAAEKMLTYALGRGVTFRDIHTLDQIVNRIEHEDGRFSALLMGVIESAPFQQRRNSAIIKAANHSS